MVDDEAADQRPDDRRGGEDGADQALVAASIAGRHDHADHRKRQREETAGADTLDGAEDHELPHVLCGSAERRAQEEDQDRDDEERLAPVDVAEPAVQGHGYGRAEHVSGEDPRVLRDPSEVGNDTRERRGDDGLVEGGKEERHHQPGVDRQDPADRELVSRWLAGEAFAEGQGDSPLGTRAGTFLRERTIPVAISSPPATW